MKWMDGWGASVEDVTKRYSTCIGKYIEGSAGSYGQRISHVAVNMYVSDVVAVGFCESLGSEASNVGR